MEKKLNFVLKLSLEEMALRSVVASLWNVAEVYDLCQNFPLYKLSVPNIEKIYIPRVENKVSELVLPESLKTRMINLVRPIFLEIINWKMFHNELLDVWTPSFQALLLQQLCWTSVGILDYQKSAEKLVCLEKLGVEKRYELACMFCLTDCIPLLWEKLPEWIKEARKDDFFYMCHEFCEDDDDDWLMLQWDTMSMVYWYKYSASILNRKEYELDYTVGGEFEGEFASYSSAFEESAKMGNKVATEYFFQRLSKEERDSSLFGAVDFAIEGRFSTSPRKRNRFRKGKFSDVVFHLLSQMTPEQQMQVLKKHPGDVLLCTMDWPWHDLFLDIADLVWDFLPETQYDSLLKKVQGSIKNSKYYFPIWFQKFFSCSPINFKRRFVKLECQSGYFLSQFFQAEDTETIKVVFRNLDHKYRVRIVSSGRFFKNFESLSRRGWCLAELCLRESTLSKTDGERLKKAAELFLTKNPVTSYLRYKLHWRRFFYFLDGINAINQKSSSKETLT